MVYNETKVKLTLTMILHTI